MKPHPYLLILAVLMTSMIEPAATENRVTILILAVETGEALPGTSITSNPSGKTLPANDNGKVVLSLNHDDTLIFSHIGYQDHIIKVDEPALFNDTTIYLLSATIDYAGITIRGFEDRALFYETPASATYISPADLERSGNQSLQPVISNAPGVRMEERTPGSYRLSIRGSTLREPFGVRNVKVYWNGFPYTEPGGNTHLNLIDFNLIDEAEILRGPAGSTFGAGTGGVLMLHSKANRYQNSGIRISAGGGSFGQLNYGARIFSNIGDHSHSLQFVQRKSEGYRDHTSLNRSSLLYSGRLAIGEKSSLPVMIHLADYFYQIPGALTADQLEANRRQSRPGSIEQNASIHMQNVMLGTGHTYENELFENDLRIAGVFRSFDHPFNLDYKRSAEQALHIRNVSSSHFSIAGHEASLSAGAELQHGFMSYRNYGNVGGRPDTLILDDEISTTNYSAFLQTKTKLWYNVRFTAGVSVNGQEHQLVRLSNAPAEPENYAQTVSIRPVVSPRIALQRSMGEQVSVFASASHGFSPPTLTEIRTAEGSVNHDLRPEQGINFETGARFRFPDIGLSFEATAFSFRAEETIVRYTSPGGVALFRNSGQTLQNGIETSAGWHVFSRDDAIFSSLNLRTAYTFSAFRFGAYVDAGEDYSGNKLTGVPPHVLTVMADARLGSHFKLSITGHYEDALPLNDANSVFSDPWFRLNARLSFERKLYNRYKLEVFTGAGNILDAEYSLGYDINAFGGRYYQPAPARHFFGGLTLHVDW